MKTFEQYLAGFSPDLWVIDEEDRRAYPMEPIYSDDRPEFLLKRTTLYSTLKRMGLEPVTYRVDGRPKSHMTEAQLALIWADLYPQRPRPQLLEELDLCLYRDPLAPIASTLAAAPRSQALAAPAPAPAPEPEVRDPLAEARRMIECKKMLLELAALKIPVPTSTLCDVLGVSRDFIRRRAQAESKDGSAFQFMSCIFKRSIHTFQQQNLWMIMPFDTYIEDINSQESARLYLMAPVQDSIDIY